MLIFIHLFDGPILSTIFILRITLLRYKRFDKYYYKKIIK